MPNSFDEDDCCGAALAEALLSGDLDAKDSWTHSRCGLEWKPMLVNGGAIRHWSPQIITEVF